MSGAFRRAIHLRAGAGAAVADIEDDFHRFTVSIEHDGQKVTALKSQALRYPWSSCAVADSALPALIGLPITSDPTVIYGYADARLQCTHQFEMAGLAVAQAARGGERRYDATFSDPVDGQRRAELRCDGELVLAWTLEDGVITAPPEHAGRRPMDFRSRTLAGAPSEEAEAILILRRTVAAGAARGLDIDAFPNAAAANRGAACFVFSTGRPETALRMYGSVRDFPETDPPLPFVQEHPR